MILYLLYLSLNNEYLLDEQLNCGGIQTSLDGEISFSGPNFTMAGSFSSEIRCVWVIAAPEQEVTELEFTNINIDGENNCTDNFIKVTRMSVLMAWYEKLIYLVWVISRLITNKSTQISRNNKKDM